MCPEHGEVFLHTAPPSAIRLRLRRQFSQLSAGCQEIPSFLLHIYTPLARIVAVITPVGSSADKYLTPPSVIISCALIINSTRRMAITILAPAPAAVPFEEEESSSEEESDGGGVHLGGDTDMPPAKRARDSTSNLVTPGEMVTDDPQWMRHVTLHSSFVHASNNTPEVTVPSLRPRARR
jgi:hypothetical protein